MRSRALRNTVAASLCCVLRCCATAITPLERTSNETNIILPQRRKGAKYCSGFFFASLRLCARNSLPIFGINMILASSLTIGASVLVIQQCRDDLSLLHPFLDRAHVFSACVVR